MSGRGLLAGFVIAVGLTVPRVAHAVATLAYVEESPFAAAQGESISISPDGLFVYSSGACGGCSPTPGISLTVFSRDVATGRLTFVQQLGDDGPYQRHALSPDATHLYIGATGSLQAYARDPVTGMVSLIATYTQGVDGVVDLLRFDDVIVSPDGGHVYVAGVRPGPSWTAAVVVFARDEVTGLLTFVESVIEPEAEFNFADLSISPDGRHVYTAGGGDSLGVFARDVPSGALTHVTSYVDGVGGVDGLRGIASVLVSPDGAQVYTKSNHDARVQTYQRDAIAGTLALVQSLFPSHGDLEAFGPNGDVLYDGYAYVYERDLATGLLTLVDRPVGPSGLGDSIVASPDDRHVYMGLWSFYIFPVLTWQRVDVRCSPAPLPGCRVPVQSGKALLKVLDKDARVTWKWLRGATTALADFGDPAGDDDYALCIYDAGGGTQPALRTLLPAGALCGLTASCWRAMATGYNYDDYLRTPEGVKKMRLRAGADGQAKITLSAREVPGLDLPLATPVTVQLQSEQGTCWSATYSTPLASDATQFKARAD